MGNRAISYIKNNVQEKLDLVRNPKKFYAELKDLGKKEGICFMLNSIEDLSIFRRGGKKI